MSRVLGIDPGAHGAFAVFDTVARTLNIIDMPVWHAIVGRRKRPRIDGIELADLFDLWSTSIDLVVMEQVSPHKRMWGSKSTLYTQGYHVGLIYMAAIQMRMPLETIHSHTWKRVMRVPNDTLGICKRFQELFPSHRDAVVGPRGAWRHDRAEAAMLAFYGADNMLKNILPGQDWRIKTTREAETGG